TVFAFGVCFFWPTMLGYTNERFPKTGAMGLAIMGGAGMLSASYVLPVIGRWYDDGIAARIPEGVTAEALQSAEAGSEGALQWASIQAEAGLEAFGQVAYLPVGLAVIFLALFVFSPKKATPNH
ncbi:MAG: MFS transporter, partial [Planctomycetota bacterium]